MMSPLHLLAVLALANSKALRDAANPADFGRLANVVERLKADVPGTLIGVLRDEAGVEWDGKHGTAWQTIVAECVRQAAIEMALVEMTAKRNEIGTLETILRHQQIAGRGNVDDALAKLKAWQAGDPVG